MAKDVMKFLKRNKSLIMLMATLLMLGMLSHGEMMRARSKRSEKRIKDSSLKILGRAGQCSGEQIEAPSGRTYILSAAHCKELADDSGLFTIVTEKGKVLQRRLVAEDAYSDLILIEGVPNLPALPIAHSYKMHDHVRTFTHGSGLDTYKTEGELIMLKEIAIGIALVDDKHPCDLPKYSKVPLDGGYFVCVMKTFEFASTAAVVPGSSGGMVVNDDGELVGVVSATDGHFGYFVHLGDIRAFTAGY